MTKRIKTTHDEQVEEARRDGYVTVAEAADLAKLAPPTIYGWARQKVVASKRVGRKYIYVKLDDVRKLAPFSA
jgi:hypothetical protein